jgi:sugar O-acyltransferase (sialic acid O-acetyltransferase NeuD family)
MKRNVALLGAGPHANVVIDILEKENQYSIVGLIDSKREIGSAFNEYSIIGRQEELCDIKKKYNLYGLLVCIGDNWLRGLVAKKVKEACPDIVFVNAIHPSVQLGKNVVIGEGVVIMPNCVVNTEAKIGNHCIINTLSSLEHNCVMEDYSSLSAGVVTGGYMTLKEYSAVALGVTIFDRVTIGMHCVIGSGSLVTKNIPDFSLAYGSPAHVIRPREIGEKYLR